MKHILIVLALVTLAGCSSITSGIGAQLENRVACTAARDKALYVSEYGPIGVASTIDAKDAAVICGAAPAAAK